MKNFVKKLSFVLAAAMVVTSVAVPVSASAATKGVTARYAGQKKSSTVVASKTIWAGGKKVNFDYVYGKKTSGVKGTWTSSDPSVVTVDSATGKATALKKGDVTVTFTPKSKKYAAVKVAVKARVRATSIILHDGADRTAPVVTNAALKVGESKTYYAELRTKTGTKSSYFVKATTSNASAAAVKNGAEDGSYKGDNYGRNVTVTANATGSSVVTLVASPYSDDRTSTYDVKAEFPVTVKTVVSTSPVYQTEAKEITVSGVASGASLVVVTGDTFTAARNNTEVVKTVANADGTTDVVLKLKDGIASQVQYTVFTADGVKVGSFVGESEKAVSVKLDDSYLKINGSDAKQVIGKIKLLNQWGNPYKSGKTVSVTATGAGKATNATASSAKDSKYSDDKLEEGAWYFTLETAKTNSKGEKLDFANGDVANVTIVASDANQNYVQTANLTVNGKSEVSKVAIYEEGFTYKTKVNSKDVYVTPDNNTFSEDNMKEEADPTYTFFIAWPQGKAPSEAPKVKVYLDGDKKTELTANAGPGLVEKLSTNGVYDEKKYSTLGNGEWEYTVSLKDVAIKAGTHTLTVEYPDNATIVSKSFKLEKDSAKKADKAKADSIVKSATLSLTPVVSTLDSTLNGDHTSVAVKVSVPASETTKPTDAGFADYNYLGEVTVAMPTSETFKTLTLTVHFNKDKSVSLAQTAKSFVSPKNPTATNQTAVWDMTLSGNTITVTKKEWSTTDNSVKTTYYVYNVKGWE